MKTSGAGGAEKDGASSSSTSLECSVSLDHQHDPDWLKKGRKDVDVGARKSGPELRPVTKPPQHDPRIQYLLPKNRGPKDITQGESVKKPPEEQPTQKSVEGQEKVQLQMRLQKQKKENLLQKRK